MRLKKSRIGSPDLAVRTPRASALDGRLFESVKGAVEQFAEHQLVLVGERGKTRDSFRRCLDGELHITASAAPARLAWRWFWLLSRRATWKSVCFGYLADNRLLDLWFGRERRLESREIAL
jgi:hypothetical protein